MYCWEKQKGESPSAYAAFCNYRETVPELSLIQISEISGSSLDRIDVWMKKFDWHDRRESFIDYIERVSTSIVESCDNSRSFELAECCEKQESDNCFSQIEKLLGEMISIVNRRISSETSEIENFKTDDVIKLISNYSKTMNDVLKFMQVVKSEQVNNEKSSYLGTAITSNPQAFELAERLLELISSNQQN